VQQHKRARTLSKEAVFVQHGGRVKEQQHRDAQVKERHHAAAAKACLATGQASACKHHSRQAVQQKSWV
jgi:hypothetical protein